MKLAFITDPLEGFNLSKDSTYAMMREAAARGHALYALHQHDLAWRNGRVEGHGRALTLEGTPAAGAWHRLEVQDAVALEAFDAVLMRKDPPFDTEYLYSTQLLELAENAGARVYNSPRAIRDHNEKLAVLRYAQYAPPTLAARSARLIHEFLSEHGDVILKPLDGMGGASIFRVRSGDPNLNVIIETLTQYERRTIMAQRYVPEITEGDKRIILVAGEPVPYALARVPKPGETRGNLAAGGTGIARELTARDREIAAAVGPALAAQGLLLVGLDVIGDWLTEINVTSPTGFQEITKQTGYNVAGRFLDALEAAARPEKPRRAA